uniref:Uncharacterized protein LOC113790140 n=1 Tax=Dermatophagoides pteronyssinus TaxID=6956 RepID=A0A6P6XQ80_DERPT|nr:uncharacterized protein LOC113790140 [Dermatophagoides pteronyssinus]
MFNIWLLLLITIGSSIADPIPLTSDVKDYAEKSIVPVVSSNLQQESIIVDQPEKQPRTAAAASAAASAASIVSLANITFSPGPNSCPPSHLFAPCDCFVHEERARIMRCMGEYNIDLNSIFQRLSIYLPKPEKHFHMFYLNNTNISYLGNVLHDITFEYIYFDGASALEFIDPNAFDITGPYVKEVRAFSTKLKQKSLEDSLMGLSSLLHLTVSNVGKCPPEEVTRPCRCEYRMDNWQWVQARFTRFVCGEESEEDLRMQYVLNANRTREQFAYSQTRRLQIYFERLSENLAKLGWQKRFDEFVIQNSAISEIPRNLFGDIIFYGVKFDNCPELTAIHPQAFQITEPFIEELTIRRTRLGNERWKLRDTFNAITSLTNLRALYLQSSGLNAIPHHAFRPLKGRFQRKLVKISINYPNVRENSIRQIGSYAFYYLSNLRSIDLSVNSIEKIYKNAFSFRWESTEMLTINLAGNNLTDNNIESGAFVELQRPVKLILGQKELGNPGLRHLEERVFRPLLNENEKNIITLSSSEHPSNGNRLQCDCQSRWIFNEIGKVRNGLRDVMCISNGSWECLPPCLVFGQDLLHCGSNQYFNIEDVFYSLNRNLQPEEKHFKRFMLSNLQIESIPNKSFGDITFETFELDDCPNLKYIDERAFSMTKQNLTKIVIRNTPQLPEMRFSSFQNLNELAIRFVGKYRLTDESFKSDLPTETLLRLRIDVDGLLPSSIESNALSYAYRPINVMLEHPENIGKQECKLLTLEEEIYAPFLAVNPENKIRINNCPIVCDCSIKWLFDAPKDWWMRVEAGEPNIGLQCDDSRSLYFYSDYDFRSCPKTNLLKYFIPDSDSKTTVEKPATSSIVSPVPSSSSSSKSDSEAISASYASSDTIAITGATTGEDKMRIEDQIPIESKQQPTQSIADVSESKTPVADNVPESKNEPMINAGEEHPSSATSGVVIKLTDVSGANDPSSSMMASNEPIVAVQTAESSSIAKNI